MPARALSATLEAPLQQVVDQSVHPLEHLFQPVVTHPKDFDTLCICDGASSSDHIALANSSAEFVMI